MADELERGWKEAVFGLIKVPSRHLPEEAEENYEKSQSG
jgi:hypothetical protein